MSQWCRGPWGRKGPDLTQGLQQSTPPLSWEFEIRTCCICSYGASGEGLGKSSLQGRLLTLRRPRPQRQALELDSAGVWEPSLPVRHTQSWPRAGLLPGSL